MKRTVVLMLLMVIGFSSCIVLSFYPLYDSDTLVMRPDLAGSWQLGDKGLWIFTVDDDEPGGMILTDINDGDTSHYSAALVRLGENYFFDLQPNLEDDTHFLSFPYPMHSFYQVKMLDEGLMELYVFDSDYLEELFKQRKIRIRHEYSEEMEMYVLTAQTPELQSFIRKYADDPKAFIDPVKLTRNS
ncbi:MAG: hypothetical protein HRU40_20315 [Saprospiraceae bacterium]|nr:hypothetical protein [Saprospiraceae bacterium]